MTQPQIEPVPSLPRPNRARRRWFAVLSVALAASQAFGEELPRGPAASVAGRTAKATSSTSKVLPVPPWRRTTFVYRAEGKRLTDVLQDFAASQGLPAVVSEDLEGIVNGNFDVKSDVFLESMSRAYNFIWYHDGTALYFYSGRAIQSRVFRLKGFRRPQVTNLLRQLEVGDARYPIRYDETQSTLYVAGPPRHVELISSVIESLDAGVAEAAGRTVQVFPLRFATAGDRMVGGTRVPGVVSTLRRLFTASSNGSSDSSGLVLDPSAELADTAAVAASYDQTRRVGLPGLPRIMLNAQGTVTAKSDTRNRTKGAQAGKNSGNDRDDVPPSIEADEGINAVVIQGRADRMNDYAALIQRLDQKPMLVELVATIIEVSSDSVEALGVNWSLTKGASSISMSGPQGGDATRITDATGVFSLGTVVSNAGRELLARVNALQGEGKAKVLSKPSVLGVANRTAVMREKRVATIRVAGDHEANLFQVEAGTLLEMTPQITSTEGGNRIKLSIYIEDGNFETTQVDQIPLVKKTEIRTEAHVREGDSLLIAGITVESDQGQRNGVPLLSRIPFIGAAFRSTENRAQRMERMFLITPRLLESAGANARAAARMSAITAANWPASAPSTGDVVVPGAVPIVVPGSDVAAESR